MTPLQRKQKREGNRNEIHRKRREEKRETEREKTAKRNKNSLQRKNIHPFDDKKRWLFLLFSLLFHLASHRILCRNKTKQMDMTNLSNTLITPMNMPQNYHQFKIIHRILRKCFIPYIFSIASLGIVTNTATVILLSRSHFTKNLRNKWTLTALGRSIDSCFACWSRALTNWVLVFVIPRMKHFLCSISSIIYF